MENGGRGDRESSRIGEDVKKEIRGIEREIEREGEGD